MRTHNVFTHEFQNINVIAGGIVNCVASRCCKKNKLNLYLYITDIKDVELTVIV